MKPATSTGARRKKLLFTCLTYLFFSLVFLITVFPIYFCMSSSFKSNAEIFGGNPFALPSAFSWDKYREAWDVGNLGITYLNSLKVTAAAIVVTGVLSMMLSYVLSRMRFRGRSTLYIYAVCGMMLPMQSVLIPCAIMFSRLGIRNSHTALICLFIAFHMSISVLILKGFMDGVSAELEEAAIMDGANTHYIFLRVICPLMVPALSTVSIFTFVSIWNNLIFPLVFISDNRLQLLSYSLLQFVGARRSDYGALMAAIVIVMILPIAAYILLQEKVEKGLTAGAVKG